MGTWSYNGTTIETLRQRSADAFTVHWIEATLRAKISDFARVNGACNENIEGQQELWGCSVALSPDHSATQAAGSTCNENLSSKTKSVQNNTRTGQKDERRRKTPKTSPAKRRATERAGPNDAWKQGRVNTASRDKGRLRHRRR